MTLKKTENIKYFPPNSETWKELSSKSDDEIDKTTKHKEELKQHLLSSMQMQNIIVLAGSGTSVGDIGGPSMGDLWNLCTKKGDNYTEETESVKQLISYDITDEDKVNIEEFLSLCEAYLQINPNEEKVKNFVSQCKQEILKACSFNKSDNVLSGHKTFIHRLSRRRARDSRLRVFTTNYDTCFEEAAGKQGIIIMDGFSFTKPRQYDPRFFDYDIVRRLSNIDSSQSYLEGVFHLYKLHGSVNWEKEDDVILEKAATPDGARMIFPAKGKYQQSYIQPHLELMARYLSALREPNTCLVIAGFGFNDDHLSEPIISAITSNPYLKVIIADPYAEKNLDGANDKASKYWPVLKGLSKKGEDILFINASFQEFSELIPDLHSLTPAEKLANNIKNLAGES